MSPARYQPFYCEENIWHLAGDLDLGQNLDQNAARHVLVIAGVGDHVALWCQRAGEPPEGLVLWDYHVVLVAGDQVYDLDTSLGVGVPLRRYFEATFRPVVPQFEPRFRVLDAAVYRAEFASDRRHMRLPDGGFAQPVPAWDTIGTGHNLASFVDMETELLGDVVDLAGLPARLITNPPTSA